MVSLPLLCLQEILGHLDPWRLSASARVCKRWRDTVRAHETWKRWLESHHIEPIKDQWKLQVEAEMLATVAFAAMHFGVSSSAGHTQLCEVIRTLPNEPDLPEALRPPTINTDTPKCALLPPGLTKIFIREGKWLSTWQVWAMAYAKSPSFLMLVEAGHRPWRMGDSRECRKLLELYRVYPDIRSLIERITSPFLDARHTIYHQVSFGFSVEVSDSIFRKILNCVHILPSKSLDVALWARLSEGRIEQLIKHGARASDFTLKVAKASQVSDEMIQLLSSNRAAD